MTRAATDPAGAIRVTLTAEAGRVAAVDILSTRPDQPARIFEGRKVDEVIRLIGRVFSLCGTAQTVAALRAAEVALGVDPAPGVEAARDLMRQAEMLTQITLRLGLHWPRVLGLPLQPEPVRVALEAERALEAAVLGSGWRLPGVGLMGADMGAAEAVLDQLDAVLSQADLGTALQEALRANGIESYGALPDGRAPEPGSLARYWSAPRVVAIRARHGAGLAARLAASLEELTQLPGAMRALLAGVEATPKRLPGRDSGQGRAEVETARGPLVHAIEIAGGIVTRCEITAPTEANFAQTGPVTTGLIGARPDLLAAELHVLAIDPCVACSVAVSTD